MTLPIIEEPLYGLVKIETSPWTATLTWTDQTASLVNGVNYAQGGRYSLPGGAQTDVGTLTATFKNLATIPAVGALVRISFSSVGTYAFVGYIQDVTQRIVFDSSVSYTTPVTLTTIHCLDWVGYISQFQVVGVGGAVVATGVYETDSTYAWNLRVAALNKSIDATYATLMINPVTSGALTDMGDTDFVGNISQHLDLVNDTALTYWYGRNVLPTNVTTGRTSLVEIRSAASLVSSAITFTDLVGSAGQMHYTEIELENSTQNIANVVVLNNRARVNITAPEITQIGGFNETNFMVINSENVVGVAVEREQKFSDATSISTYGNRQAEFNTNVAIGGTALYNLVGNPSAEYSDDGYSGGASVNVRRRKPLEDGASIAAFNGQWSIRSRQAIANATATIQYVGGETDGTPVVAGTTYTFSAYALKHPTASSANAQVRIEIDWLNEGEATISTAASVNVGVSSTAWIQRNVTSIAPAGAVRARLKVVFSRSSGANLPVADKYYADALLFSIGIGVITYFDGDSTWDNSFIYAWTGGVGLSPSLKIANKVDEVATAILAQYSTSSIRASRIRWNAQEDLSKVPTLSVGKTISLVYNGTTTTHRIVGIDGNIDSERYMIDYYLRKI